jgi:hypothetical protein
VALRIRFDSIEEGEHSIRLRLIDEDGRSMCKRKVYAYAEMVCWLINGGGVQLPSRANRSITAS